MAHLRVAHLCVLQVPSGLLSEVSLKAVMVWIYGGAFTQGNAQQRLGSRKKVLFSMALPLRGEGGGDKGLAIKKNKIFWGIFVEFFVDMLSKFSTMFGIAGSGVQQRIHGPDGSAAGGRRRRHNQLQAQSQRICHAFTKNQIVIFVKIWNCVILFFSRLF